MWKAPEFIEHSDELKGSQKGDIYSFGIVINEIITRLLPFETYDDPPKVIVERIVNCEEPPFRPEMEDSSSDQVYIGIL